MAGFEQIRLTQFWCYEVTSVEDEEKARRRFTELFKTDAKAGKGGSGQVIQVMNAFGEVFALKTPNLDFPSNMSEEYVTKNRKARIEAFKQEYKNQATFCRARNFPKVYGLGEIGDSPCMLTTVSFVPLFAMFIVPIVASALAFLITPKNDADIAVGTVTVIALTAFTQSLTSGWTFVSEYVAPILVITQVVLTVIFTTTICASRRQV